METLIKIADARPFNHDAYLKNWLDGQIIESRWDGFDWGIQERKNFLILRTTDDFWQVRGGNDWKIWNTQARDFKKYFSAVDSTGKHCWEAGFLADENRLRMRDWFFDINQAYRLNQITQTQFEKLYAHGEEAGIITINASLFDLLKNEYTQTRELTPIKNQGITSGTYSIGSGLDYSTVTAFATDVNAGGTMTGNLTGEHNNEETSISTTITFDTNTNGFLLKLTAQTGDEHNGGAYGNGARINFGTTSELRLDDTGTSLDDVEISNLALDASGANNTGVYVLDAGDNGNILINRMLIKGDTNSISGLRTASVANNVTFSNNIIYGVRLGNTGDATAGILLGNVGATQVINVFNNTIVKCLRGIKEDDDSPEAANHTFKNNLMQGNTTDWVDDGAGPGTTAKNISEDATSPDVAYRSLNLHDGTSNFVDYANDDYRLDSGGDALTTLDDGDDLSGIFTDDIVGTTRSTWYIGAFELVAADVAAQSSKHTHVTQKPLLTLEINSALQQARHTHIVELPNLNRHIGTIAHNTRHAHTSDLLTLDTSKSLTIHSSRHAHTLARPALSLDVNLSAQATQHIQTSEVVSPQIGVTLKTLDTLHQHTSDTLLTTIGKLVNIQDAKHVHTSERPDISAALISLVTQSATHTHKTTIPAVTSSILLAAIDTNHIHTSPVITISVSGNIIGSKYRFVNKSTDLAFTAMNDKFMVNSNISQFAIGVLNE